MNGISTMTAIIGAVGMILASAFTSWASSSSATAEVKNTVSIVQEREANHYLELKGSVDEMKEILRAAPWNKTIK